MVVLIMAFVHIEESYDIVEISIPNEKQSQIFCFNFPNENRRIEPDRIVDLIS
jgi:hypothetical protein